MTIWDVDFQVCMSSLIRVFPTQPPDVLAKDAAGFADAMTNIRRARGR